MNEIDFKNIVKQSKAQGIKPGTPDSIDWFREKALDIARNKINVDARDLINTKQPFKRIVSLSETSIGKMYMFIYDPKLKNKLPYYDTYPLIFPIEYYGDSFLGINMHYLSPIVRANFMNALHPLLNNDKYNKTTRLNISYKILKGAKYIDYMKPCIKKYLFSHVKSNFLYVSPDEWSLALMLPTHNFVQTIGETDKSVSTSSIYRKSGSATF